MPTGRERLAELKEMHPATGQGRCCPRCAVQRPCPVSLLIAALEEALEQIKLLTLAGKLASGVDATDFATEPVFRKLDGR